MPSYVIKAAVSDPNARTFSFVAQKAIYGGKHIAEGDEIFIFASENEGGQGLIARGIVISAKSTPKKRGVVRQTPRVSIMVKRTVTAKRQFGGEELRAFRDLE
ncbi:MAG TPA: hypothetical protein VGG10_17260 [Rhizomicrobium sp.]|jgi:hypothetical protein